MQEFAVTGPAAVVLEIPAGSIRLVATDRAEAAVKVARANAAKKRDVKAAEQTTVEHHDGVLRIATADPGRILGSSGSLVVTIEVPAGSSFDGKAGAATLHSTGRLGPITFHGGYQHVNLDETTGAHPERPHRHRHHRPPHRPGPHHQRHGRHHHHRSHHRQGRAAHRHRQPHQELAFDIAGEETGARPI
jgi:hypothetical protein